MLNKHLIYSVRTHYRSETNYSVIVELTPIAIPIPIPIAIGTIGTIRIEGFNSPVEKVLLRMRSGEMQEWFNWHAWKACVRQKCTAGSNPALSAKKEYCSLNYC